MALRAIVTDAAQAANRTARVFAVALPANPDIIVAAGKHFVAVPAAAMLDQLMRCDRKYTGPLFVNEINYRNMRIADYDAVVELWQGCEGLSIRDADSRDGVERYLARNPGLSFVAEQGAIIVGSLMAGHDGKRGYIQHLAVARQARRQGIASCLVARCLDALQAEGIEKSHVHVLKNNAHGRAYWSRLGWRERGEVVMYSFINGDNENA